eukprot:TRINITY_DN4018_c0_g1_i1.p1 TRINITY_DN4018_c0_g1~~TRINITY_DN4018_c0_g1_i1.p1  ORF type:complete len:984 (+),score=292.65 TRINITY_DN4018_c0_g1_i1:46-2997(+)
MSGVRALGLRLRKGKTPSADHIQIKDETKLSKTEQDIVIKAFLCILEQSPTIMSSFGLLVPSGEYDQLCSVLVDLSILTGTTFPMIRSFIQDEFEKNSKEDPGSIMRGNCLASKLIKQFLNRIGAGYLKEVCAPVISQLTELGDRVLEIDPVKMDRPDDLEANKKELLEKVRNTVQHIVSPEMIHKMPLEIKTIASYFAEFANAYAPSQFYPLVGGFLLLRYINPGLINAEQTGVIADTKMTPNVRRNITLITKIVQNLSNGIEFTQKEQYMTWLNDFIKANSWRMEKYFQTVSLPVNVPKLAEPKTQSEADIRWFHNLLTKNTDRLIQLAEEDKMGDYMGELLDGLGQYRHIDKFLEKKYSADQPATIRLSIETQEGTYEEALEGSVLLLQPLILKLTSEISKHAKKQPKPTEPKKGDSKNSTKEDNSTKVFGRNLEELMAQQQTKFPSLRVPVFLQDALQFILLRGLGTEGIFRISGDKGLMDTLKKEIDKGERLNGSRQMDINDVTGLVKSFFRELPGGIFSNTNFEQLVSAGLLIHSTQIERIRTVVLSLPKSHQYALEALMRVLWIISYSSATNNMTSSNLSISIGPSLIDSHVSLTTDNASSLNSSVEVMISCYEVIFKDIIAQVEDPTLPILKMKLAGHKKSITSMTCTDGLVCTSSGSIMRIWDSEKFTFLREIDVGTTNGTILATLAANDFIWCAADKNLSIWNPQNGEMKLANLHKGASTLTFVPGTNSVWVNSLEQPIIFIYHTGTFKLLKKINAPEHIFSLASIDKQVWGGSSMGSLFVWDFQTGNLIKEMKMVHKKKVNSIAGVENHVWSASDDGVIVVHRKDTQEEEKRIETHSGKVKQLVFHNDQVWCGSWDMSIKIFEKTFELVHEIRDVHSDAISGFEPIFNKSRDRFLMWVASYDATVTILVLPSRKSLLQRKTTVAPRSMIAAKSSLFAGDRRTFASKVEVEAPPPPAVPADVESKSKQGDWFF